MATMNEDDCRLLRACFGVMRAEIAQHVAAGKAAPIVADRMRSTRDDLARIEKMLLDTGGWVMFPERKAVE